MRFHLPSFILGCVAGASGSYLARRFRPVALEVATAIYRVADGIAVRAAIRREDFEDLLAEARARARRQRPQPAAEGAAT
jgi:hypothetical protein